MCAAYGWTLEQVAGMTPAQFEYAYRHLPDVELRRAYPVAALEASVRNAMGGKGDPNDDKAKTMPPEQVYQPTELLPWFARPDWLDGMHSGIPAEAARDFLRHVKTAPSWVLQLAPMGAIKAAAD